MPHEEGDPGGEVREQLRDAQQRRADAREAGDAAARILACRDCGDAHFALGDTDLPFALRLFREAMELIESHGLHRELLPELLGMTGRTLQRMKRWDQVTAWYRRAAEEAGRQGLSAQELRWLVKEATTTLDMNDEARGRALLDQAIERGRSMLKAGQRVEEPLADALQRLANLDITTEGDVEALWDEIDALLSPLPVSRAHYRQAMNRAAWHAGHDRPLIAQTFMEEGLETSVALGFDEQERVQLGLRLAELLRKENEPVQAGDRLLALLPHCRDDRNRQEVLTDAVDAYFAGNAWGPMHAAAVQLRELRQRTLGPGWQYDAAMRGAVALRGLTDYGASLEWLREALSLARQCEKPEWITAARGQTAIVLLDQRRFAEAAALGEELWAEGDRQPLTVRTLVRALIGDGRLACPERSRGGEASLPAREGRLDRAEAITAEFEGGGAGDLDVAQLRAHLADAGRGNPREAWHAVAQAAAQQPHARAEALTRLLALTPSGPERFALAAERVRLLDRARVRVNVFSDASWRATFEHADELPGWLDDFVVEALEGHQDEVALYEMERFRAQTLVSMLAERRAVWSADDQRRGWFKALLTAKLQRERERFKALAARGVGWRERRAAAEEIARLEGAALSAEGLIHLAPNDLGMNFPQSLAELLGEHRLADGECLLFAHALPERLALWARFADGTTHRTTLPAIGRAAIARMGNELRLIGQDGTTPDIAAVMEELDRACARPLAGWLGDLGAARAFLSAGTAIAGLPIDCCPALLTAPAPELVLLPTAAALGFVRGKRTPASEMFLVTKRDRLRAARTRMKATRGRVLVVADPSHDLEFAPFEGAAVAAVHEKRRPQLIDSPVVDTADLARACSQVEVLHFVGHGDFDDANPYLSGVTIAPSGTADALWTNGDIFGSVDAPSGRLAVLSGCETGHTLPNLVSEEVSLPAAFIAAGYAAVVASRWAVDDLSATLLMADFHERWSAGGRSAAATLAASRRWLRDLPNADAQTVIAGLAERAAQAMPARAEHCRRLCADALTLLAAEGDTPFADPLYWAAFFVAGDGAITADGPDPRVP